MPTQPAPNASLLPEKSTCLARSLSIGNVAAQHEPKGRAAAILGLKSISRAAKVAQRARCWFRLPWGFVIIARTKSPGRPMLRCAQNGPLLFLTV